MAAQARRLAHGWFDIPGVQTGERKLEEQTAGLERVHAAAKGATILDLGCAEGLIGKWLLDAGAARFVGVEKHVPYVETARQQLSGYPASFVIWDLDDGLPPGLPRPDITLALNILQKLAEPEITLQAIANLTRNILALSLPHAVLDDVRSGNRRMDPRDVLTDFQFIHEREEVLDRRRGSLGRRMIFQRRGK